VVIDGVAEHVALRYDDQGKAELRLTFGANHHGAGGAGVDLLLALLCRGAARPNASPGDRGTGSISS